MTKKYVFQQSKIPAYSSNFGKRLARALWDRFLWFSDARKDREQWVSECDAAYLCHRYVPDTEGIELIEDGEFGESDIHDAANVISIRLALALMPRNEPWLTVSSKEGEGDKVVKAIQEQQMFLHRKAKSRRQIQRVIKQGIVRGTTYLNFDWEDRYRLRRAVPTDHAKQLSAFLKSQGMTPKDAKRFSTARGKELIFSGPVCNPVDFYDVWLNPRADIINTPHPAYIMRRFKFMSELQSQRDDNDEKVYKNLDGIEPYDIEDLSSANELLGGRIGSDRLFGIMRGGGRYQSKVKMVPVYIFYMPYFEFDGYEFYDTYFHIAVSRKGERARLILVEENQNDLGINHLLIDHYVDFYTPTPYGISGVQYQVGKLHQKNFLQLLTVTAAAHSIFPPNLTLESAFRDEDDLHFGAGRTNWVLDNPLGLDVTKPIEMPVRGTQLGEQTLRFWADDIKAGTGIDGLTPNNAARSLGKNPTATEINRDVSSGSFFLDNQAENLQDMLSDYVQGVWMLTQSNIKPSLENPQAIEYQKYLDDRVVESLISMEDIKTKRSVQVTGITGLLKGQQDLQNLDKFFQTVGQINDPGVTPLKLYLAQVMARKLDINLPEEFTKSPVELVSENPQVQMLALQNAMQNPQVQQAIMQMMAPPQGGNDGGIPQSVPGAQPQQGAL